MPKTKINIDKLIEIVANGGIVRTGIDIYSNDHKLLLEKDVPVNSVKPLLYIKNNGVQHLEIDTGDTGGVWDENGKPITAKLAPKTVPNKATQPQQSEVQSKLNEINELTKEAAVRYQQAKKNIQKVLSDIKRTGGEFDHTQVEHTVTDLLAFLSLKENAFSYLTKEIFSYDAYLYNHSINVCTIGITILKKFNDHFGQLVNTHLFKLTNGFNSDNEPLDNSFKYYLSEDIYHIALGFFLHDVGKVLIPDKILNKKGALSKEEFDLVKTHSYVKGVRILEKNGQDTNPFIKNIVQYHHSPMFKNENNCYPLNTPYSEIPAYVKISKLADIYDAMTSKRCYKEAINPVSVVTEIFRKYAEKDHLLQFILHAFVKSVGIYPPGSIIHMQNGQVVYILDSDGPLVIPITDTRGVPLSSRPDPIKLGSEETKQKGLCIDRREPLISPLKAYDILPDYLKQTFSNK